MYTSKFVVFIGNHKLKFHNRNEKSQMAITKLKIWVLVSMQISLPARKAEKKGSLTKKKCFSLLFFKFHFSYVQ